MFMLFLFMFYIGARTKIWTIEKKKQAVASILFGINSLCVKSYLGRVVVLHLYFCLFSFFSFYLFLSYNVAYCDYT